MTAAATLSSASRFSKRTPCVARPAERTVLVSMRMILPHWLTGDTTYYYAVQAVDTGSNTSPLSTVVAATTPK